jgi:hypothetical protein
VSAVFAVPTISQFSCTREVSTVRLALERARHTSQFLKKGNVTFEITEHAYQISAPGRSGGTSFNEEIERQANVPVAVSGNGADAEIMFQENSGSLILDEDQEYLEVVVGENDTGCQKRIEITYVGTIL